MVTVVRNVYVIINAIKMISIEFKSTYFIRVAVIYLLFCLRLYNVFLYFLFKYLKINTIVYLSITITFIYQNYGIAVSYYIRLLYLNIIHTYLHLLSISR